MNNDINNAMQNRDFHHRKALKPNCQRHWNKYKAWRNTTNHLVKSAKSKYYCDLIEEAKGNSK